MKLLQKTAGLQYCPTEKKGIIGALQTALEEVSGLYLSRMDSDDLMPKNRLKNMLAVIESSPAKTIVTGLVKYFSNQPVSDGYLGYEKWLNGVNAKGRQWHNVYRECVIASPNWMVRTLELKALGGFNLLQYPEDYHLVLKWYQKGFQICFLDELSLFWREHPERTSRNSENYSQKRFFELKVSFFLENDFKSGHLLLWGSGVKARLTASILKRNGIDFSWMDLNPEKFPNGIDGHTISSYTDLKKYTPESTQVLLSIYPTDRQKTELDNYLDKYNFVEGKNFWYL